MGWIPTNFSGSGINSTNELGINAIVANNNGLAEGNNVSCSLVMDTKSISSCQITPASEEDFNIMNHSRDNISLSLLNQINIINQNQVPFTLIDILQILI